MTWTYSSNPSASDNDEVRFLVGDTNSADEQVSDEEIAYAVAVEANNTQAAVRIARALAAKYARAVDKSVGDLRISYSQRQQHYLDLATKLESGLSTTRVFKAVPYAGGISRSDKDAVEDGTDRVRPNFKVGQDDNPQRNYGDDYYDPDDI